MTNPPRKSPADQDLVHPIVSGPISRGQRTVRTAAGADAVARVFAAAYAANVARVPVGGAGMRAAHMEALLCAHEAVDNFMFALDQEVSQPSA